MSVSIYTVCDNVCTTLAADATITAYCTAANMPAPRIYLGVNPDKPPDESCVPWIGIAPGSSGIAEQWNSYAHSLRMAVVTNDSRVVSDGQITRMLGLKTIEGLADLVHRATWAYLENPTLGYTNLAVDDYQIETVFPFYRATWTIRVATAT